MGITGTSLSYRTDLSCLTNTAGHECVAFGISRRAHCAWGGHFVACVACFGMAQDWGPPVGRRVMISVGENILFSTPVASLYGSG
jgi:hypothetical protein